MIDIAAAKKHFKKHDPVMAELVKAGFTHERPIKPPEQSKPEDYFRDLASAIVSQQISVKAAVSIWKRFETLVGKKVAPTGILKFTVEDLRAVGLSNSKASYILGIAEDIQSGRVVIDDLAELSDEEVIERLVLFKGIGRWSAEMFLMFSLVRPNVFSILDLGLIKAVRQNYDLKPHMTRKFVNVVELWSPHKTLASLALWHSLDNEPVVL